MANGSDPTVGTNGSKTISGVWWIDLLRREGVLLALVVGYAYYIAIPESRLKQAALTATQAMADKLTETVVKIDANVEAQKTSLKNQETSLDRLTKFSDSVNDEHKTMLKSQTVALSNHEKILTNQSKIIDGEVEQLKAANQILECSKRAYQKAEPKK